MRPASAAAPGRACCRSRRHGARADSRCSRTPCGCARARCGWPHSAGVRHAADAGSTGLFLRLFGVRVIGRGRPPGDTPTLVLANHVSWLDIPVIGSLRPLSFVAKSEVASWPVVGLAGAAAAHGLHRPRRAARRPPRSTRRWPTGSRAATSSCCSPKAPPATATACCRSARRSSARPGPRSLNEPAHRASCCSRSPSPIRAATACR